MHKKIITFSLLLLFPLAFITKVAAGDRLKVRMVMFSY